MQELKALWIWLGVWRTGRIGDSVGSSSEDDRERGYRSVFFSYIFINLLKVSLEEMVAGAVMLSKGIVSI